MYDFLIDIFKNSTLINKLENQIIAQSFEDGTILLNKYPPDKIIHLENDPCNSIEIILDGKVLIDNIDISGDFLRITELKKGDLIGGNIIFLKDPVYPMTITALSEVTIAEIEKDNLLKLLSANKDFLSEFLSLMAQNAFILTQKIKTHINKSLRNRLLEYLEFESSKQNNSTITLPISKKSLAEKMGVQRTSLSRELKKMENDNLLIFKKNKITIL